MNDLITAEPTEDELIDSFVKKYGLDRDEYEQSLDAFVVRMEREEEERQQFVHERQDSVMEEVYQYLRREKRINQEDIQYSPENYPFTLREFCLFFDNLANYAQIVQKESENEKIIFENNRYFLRLKDLLVEMYIVWGQGTMMGMTLLEEKSWQESLSFSYEDYKKSLEFPDKMAELKELFAKRDELLNQIVKRANKRTGQGVYEIIVDIRYLCDKLELHDEIVSQLLTGL